MDPCGYDKTLVRSARSGLTPRAKKPLQTASERNQVKWVPRLDRRVGIRGSHQGRYHECVAERVVESPQPDLLGVIPGPVKTARISMIRRRIGFCSVKVRVPSADADRAIPPNRLCSGTHFREDPAGGPLGSWND